jgi:hypothetical protein
MSNLNTEKLIKYRSLEVTAFACNSTVHKMLYDYMYKDVGDFIFYEYFLFEPYIRDSSLANVKLFAPFLRRIIHSHNWVPVWDTVNLPSTLEEINFDIKNEDLLERFKWNEKVEVDLKVSELGKKLIREWNSNHDICYEVPRDASNLPIPFHYSEIEAQFSTKIHDLRRNQKDSWIKIYALTGLHWFKLSVSDFQVQYIAFPISTRNAFYGYLMLVFNRNHLKPSIDFQSWASKLGSFIKEEIVSKYYLPILILFHNSFLEKKILSYIDKEKGNTTYYASSRNKNKIYNGFVRKTEPYIKLKNLGLTTFNNNDNEMLEYRICQLWHQRRKYFKNNIKNSRTTLKRNSAINIILNSFIFSKYFVASPGLVGCIKEIVKFNLKPKENYLQSALIFGGPGSGKDNMAEIIRVFGDETYAFGEKHVINMASLKPPALAIPLLVGTENIKPFVLKGLLNSVKSKYDTFIFDELNSLDIESQGALLRILENGEINPLGSLRKKKVNYLIIGIVNELPELLMKENITQKLEATKLILGEAITDFLMNYIHTSKRFRSDLYYRMIRGGEIRILPLKDRKDDIPILFYVFCNSEKDLRFKDNPVLDIELSVYEELIQPNHFWYGNVRELQSIARLTINGVGNLDGSILKIRIKNLTDAFKKYSQNIKS